MGIDRRMTLRGLLALAGFEVTAAPAPAGDKSARRRRRIAKRNVAQCISDTSPESTCYQAERACCYERRDPRPEVAHRAYCECLKAASGDTNDCKACDDETFRA